MRFLNKFSNDELIIRYFPMINFVIGLVMFFPQFISHNFQGILNEFMPLWLWGIVLIVGASIGFYTFSRRYYVITVSLPLLLYASVIWRGFILHSTATITGVFTYTLLGIFSVIFAGRILK